MKCRLITLSIIVLLLTQSSDLSAPITKCLATRRVTTVQRCKVGYGSVAQEKQSPPNAWRGLVPLRSARNDVESLLGKPKTSHGVAYVYETKDETVDVLYSAGPCKLSTVERWNVAADIVIRIDVRPRAKMLIDALRLDKVRYPRLPEAHPENWARYMNTDDGVMVETIMFGKDEEVYTVTYWPRAADKGLRCSMDKFLGQ